MKNEYMRKELEFVGIVTSKMGDLVRELHDIGAKEYGFKHKGTVPLIRLFFQSMGELIVKNRD